jgi:hypothetical protein
MANQTLNFIPRNEALYGRDMGKPSWTQSTFTTIRYHLRETPNSSIDLRKLENHVWGYLWEDETAKKGLEIPGLKFDLPTTQESTRNQTKIRHCAHDMYTADLD